VKLISNSTVTGFLVLLSLVFVWGCNKSSPPNEDEVVHRVSVRFCAKLMTDPTASERVRSLAKDVLIKRENGIIDPEPVLIRAGLHRFKRTGPGLIIAASDENGDLAGIVVKEWHRRSGEKPVVIEEQYPIFGNGVEKAVFYRAFPVVIRKGDERKSEKDWKVFLDEGRWDAEQIPALWLSLPEPGNVDIEISVYDRSAHKSPPVSIENWMTSDHNDVVGIE